MVGFFTRLAVILYYNRVDLPTCIKSLNTMSRITDVRERERAREREREREREGDRKGAFVITFPERARAYYRLER